MNGRWVFLREVGSIQFVGSGAGDVVHTGTKVRLESPLDAAMN